MIDPHRLGSSLRKTVVSQVQFRKRAVVGQGLSEGDAADKSDAVPADVETRESYVHLETYFAVYADFPCGH